jgi:hypothetical protein
MSDYSGLILTGVILGGIVWMLLAASANDRANTERLVETTNQEDRQLQTQVDEMNDMLFYKDETTGLCFASTGGYRSRTMASVDCTKLNNPIPFWSK